MLARVADQLGGGVEAHRLVAEESGIELRRVVREEVHRFIGGVAEGGGVFLAEAVAGIAHDVAKDRFRHLPGDAS